MRELIGSALALLLLPAIQHSFASVGACRERGRMQECLQHRLTTQVRSWGAAVAPALRFVLPILIAAEAGAAGAAGSRAQRFCHALAGSLARIAQQA